MKVVLVDDPTLKDYKEAIDLHNEVFSKFPGYEEYSATIAEELMKNAHDPAVVKVFSDNSDLVAYAMCYERYKGYYHIWQIGVWEKFRRQGAATKMYETIEDHANSKKYKGVTINSFKDYTVNINLIKKRGYKLYKKDTGGKYSKNPKLMYKKTI